MGHYSLAFTIEKGTRQGCPLSSLIFAIAIKTLARAIRSQPDIRGFLWLERAQVCIICRQYVALHHIPADFHTQYISNTLLPLSQASMLMSPNHLP